MGGVTCPQGPECPALPHSSDSQWLLAGPSWCPGHEGRATVLSRRCPPGWLSIPATPPASGCAYLPFLFFRSLWGPDLGQLLPRFPFHFLSASRAQAASPCHLGPSLHTWESDRGSSLDSPGSDALNTTHEPIPRLTRGGDGAGAAARSHQARPQPWRAGARRGSPVATGSGPGSCGVRVGKGRACTLLPSWAPPHRVRDTGALGSAPGFSAGRGCRLTAHGSRLAVPGIEARGTGRGRGRGPSAVQALADSALSRPERKAAVTVTR